MMMSQEKKVLLEGTRERVGLRNLLKRPCFLIVVVVVAVGLVVLPMVFVVVAVLAMIGVVAGFLVGVTVTGTTLAGGVCGKSRTMDSPRTVGSPAM